MAWRRSPSRLGLGLGAKTASEDWASRGEDYRRTGN